METSDCIEHAMQYLELLFADGDWVELRLVPPGRSKWFQAGDRQHVSAAIEWALQHNANPQPQNIYVGANPRYGDGKRGDKNVQIARAVFADLDKGCTADTAKERIAAAALPTPSMLIESGGGIHAYWLLTEPLRDMAAWVAIQKGLINALDSDKTICNAERIMRLPGSRNVKPDRPGQPLCRIIAMKDERYPANIFPARKAQAASVAPTQTTFPAGSMSSLSRKFILDGYVMPAGRRQTCFAVACDLAARGWTVEDATVALMPRVQQLGLTAEDVEDIPRQIRNAFGKPREPIADSVVGIPNGIASTGPVKLDDISTHSDIGFARRLVHEARGTLRYCRETKSWLAWNGKRWLKDDGLAAQHVAKRVSDMLWRELAELPSDDDRKRAVPFVKSASSARAIDAAVKLARSEPGVTVSMTELDCKPYLLNVANGTLDLKTLELLPHNPEHLLTHLADVEFDSLATCPAWEKFISDVTDNDDALAGFLQRSCGLALSGDVSEHALWLHYGEGRNGKSTLLNILGELLGSYYGPAPMDMLLIKHGRSKEQETMFANLAGKRLVTSVEADSGVRFSEATVKLLTGGDTVAARHLYGAYWSLTPSWKLHVAANHKPIVRGQDEGIWRRLMLTPWMVTFDGNREDKGLKDKLRSEFPGILGWCVVGFQKWLANGLVPPESVTAATSEYRSENDVLAQWIDECCIRQETAAAKALDLYRSFKGWADERGEFCPSSKAMGSQLERMGFRKERPSGGPYRGSTIRRGIGLLAD